MKELFDLVASRRRQRGQHPDPGRERHRQGAHRQRASLQLRRAKGPFIKINCAAIPKDLIERELFGYKKGAFTGATSDKVGLLELAEGGSLLLDEIGEMPSYLQTKLLRVLQEREYRPIGSDRIMRVDFRLICATNIDIEAALREGRLREDLYFRINTITMRVPSLRERTEDIPLLCDHFLVVQPAVSAQRAHDLAGGVSPADPEPVAGQRARARERDRASGARGERTEITPADLPDTIREDGGSSGDLVIPPHRTLAEIERMAIVQALAADELEQAGSGGAARALSPDALQQDAETQDSGRRPREAGERQPGAARAAGHRGGRGGACVIGPRCCLDSWREPSSAAPRAGSS